MGISVGVGEGIGKVEVIGAAGVELASTAGAVETAAGGEGCPAHALNISPALKRQIPHKKNIPIGEIWGKIEDDLIFMVSL
jgi:hypothetical protein